MGPFIHYCDSQISTKQNASYDVRNDNKIMTSQLLRSYVTDPCYAWRNSCII